LLGWIGILALVHAVPLDRADRAQQEDDAADAAGARRAPYVFA
jgi:hypothetical protein